MKIAILNQPIGTINLPWYGQGGSISIWIYEVAQRLAKCCEVVVYTKKSRYSKKVEFDKGVKYLRISTFFDSWFEYLSKAVDKIERTLRLKNLRHILFFRNIKRPLFASKFYYLIYSLQVAYDLKKEKCDIVHIFNFSQFIPIIKTFNPKIKIILHMQCDWLTQLDHTYIEKNLKEVDLVIGCSEYITNRIRIAFPWLANRCKTVYNAVDINNFIRKDESVKKDTQRLLYVGRISPEKGVHVLLDAFMEVIKTYPKAHLNLVGPIYIPHIEFIFPFDDDHKMKSLALLYQKTYSSYLQKKITKNISNNISFLGEVKHKELIKHYQKTDIFMFPSVWNEPFGIPIIEAMATEVPVIATRVGGIPEIIEEEKTGVLVEPDDDQALAEAITYLFSDNELKKTMGEAARKRVIKLFTWDHIILKLLHHYNNILKNI